MNDETKNTIETSTTPPRKPRGFAALDPETRRAISAKGGAASHAMGVAHRFTSDEAKVAGRKGGLRSKAKKEAAAKEDGK